MARSPHAQRFEVTGFDGAVKVGVDEVEAGRRSPVAEQARLDVGGSQGLGEQRIGHEVDLAHGKVVRGPPVGVQGAQFVVGQ